PGERLIVHGNNKSDADVAAAVAAGAGLLVADHAGELDQIERLAAAAGRVQLGSQIGSVETYLEAAAWLAAFIDREGVGELPLLDLGGGLAIAYADGDAAPDVREAVTATAAGVAAQLRDRGLPLPELILEPGRSIAGPSGVTLYTVGAIKRTAAGVTYAAVDGGMADNPRPAMYGA